MLSNPHPATLLTAPLIAVAANGAPSELVSVSK